VEISRTPRKKAQNLFRYEFSRPVYTVLGSVGRQGGSAISRWSLVVAGSTIFLSDGGGGFAVGRAPVRLIGVSTRGPHSIPAALDYSSGAIFRFVDMEARRQSLPDQPGSGGSGSSWWKNPSAAAPHWGTQRLPSWAFSGACGDLWLVELQNESVIHRFPADEYYNPHGLPEHAGSLQTWRADNWLCREAG